MRLRSAGSAILFAVCVLTPQIALAQSPSDQPAPGANQSSPPVTGSGSTPLEQAAQRFTRAQAETLISQANAAGFFEIVTGPQDSIALRHRASGMVCRFMPNDQNRLSISTPSDPNSAVACTAGPGPSTVMAALHMSMRRAQHTYFTVPHSDAAVGWSSTPIPMQRQEAWGQSLQKLSLQRHSPVSLTNSRDKFASSVRVQTGP